MEERTLLVGQLAQLVDVPATVSSGQTFEAQLRYTTTANNDGTGGNTNDKANFVGIEVFWNNDELVLTPATPSDGNPATFEDGTAAHLDYALNGLLAGGSSTPKTAAEIQSTTDNDDRDNDANTTHRVVFSHVSTGDTFPGFPFSDHTNGANIVSLEFTPAEGFTGNSTALARVVPDGIGAASGNAAVAVDPTVVSVRAAPGVTISETGGTTSVNEVAPGNTDTFDVVLTAVPFGDVVLTLSSNNAGATLSSSSLTFTTANWNVAQTVTVTGVDDGVHPGNRTATITVDVSSAADNDYNALPNQTVNVTVVDNGLTGPGITISETGGVTEVAETGTTDTLGVVLDAAPTSDVVLALASSDTGEVTVSAAALTFTPANWNVAQTVTVTGQPDNEIADGDVTATITVAVDDAASDAAYANVENQTVAVTNRSHVTSTTLVLNGRGRVWDFVDVSSTTLNDNLSAELRATDGTILAPGVAGSSQRVSLAGFPAGTYEVWLNDQVANYTLTLSPDFGISTGEPQTAALDLDGDGSFRYGSDGLMLLAYTLGVRGAGLEVFTAPDSTRSGDDIESVIEQLANSLDIDGDATVRFANDGTLLLWYALGLRGQQLESARAAGATRTAAGMEARIAGLLASESGGGIGTPSQSGPAQIVVAEGPSTAVPGGEIEVGLIYHTASNSDGSGVNTNEKARTIAVELFWNQSMLDVNAGSTTFHQGGTLYNGLQTAYIRADADDRDQNPKTTHTTILYWASTSDPLPSIGDHSNGISLATLRFDVKEVLGETSVFARLIPDVDVSDRSFAQPEVSSPLTINVFPTFSVTETGGNTTVSESGETDTFDVVLGAAPASDVVLNVTSDDTGEVIVSTSPLTFTPANWNVAQTVTVTGQPDNEIADGDVTATITVAVDDAASDAAYADVENQTVSVTNRSHITSTTLVLNGRGRVTDFVDVSSTTGNTNLSAELRAANGTILAPGRAGASRVSLAGFPAGSYELWVNDRVANYTLTLNPSFGTSTGEPANAALDLDGDGSNRYGADGLILLAYTLGVRGAGLEEFRAPGDQRTGAEIETVIGQLANSLDIDGDGTYRFANDGTLFLWYALGLRGEKLEPAGAAGATRTGAGMEARITGLLESASGGGFGSPSGTGPAQIVMAEGPRTARPGDEIPIALIYHTKSNSDGSGVNTNDKARTIAVELFWNESVLDVNAGSSTFHQGGTFYDGLETAHIRADVDDRDQNPQTTHTTIFYWAGTSEPLPSIGDHSNGISLATLRFDVKEVLGETSVFARLVPDVDVSDPLFSQPDVSAPLEIRVAHDNTPPAVASIERSDSNPTNASSVDFLVTFTERVSGIELGDFVLSESGTADGSVSGISAASGSVVTVTVNSLSGDGGIILGFDADASGGVSDAAGNVSTADFIPARVEDGYTLDNTLPAVVSIERSDSNPTKADSVDFLVTFTEIVSGVELGDFVLNEFGTASGEIAEVSATNGVAVTVTVNSVAGDGEIILGFDADASGGVIDAAGNVSTVDFIPDMVGDGYTVDNTPPAATIVEVSPNPRDTRAGVATINFTDDVDGVDVEDFSLRLNDSAISLAGLQLSGSGVTRTIDLASVTAEPGQYVFTLHAANSGIRDTAGNEFAENATVSWTKLGDRLETNNTAATATDVAQSQRLDDLSIHSATDVDLFSFTVGQDSIGTSRDYVEILFSQRDGDLSLALKQLRSDGTFNLLGRSDSVTDNERLSFDELQPGRYFVEVAGSAGAPDGTARYDIDFRLPRPLDPNGDTLEPNNSTADAVRIEQSVLIQDLSIHSSTDTDFFRITIPEGMIGSFRDYVEISFSPQVGDLDLNLLDDQGAKIALSAGVSATERIELQTLPAGDYFVQVVGFGGALGAYDIVFEVPESAAGDALEDNNDVETATRILESRRINRLSIHADDDVDVFTFTVPAGAVGTSDNFVQINFSNSQGDLDLQLLDSEERKLRSSAGSSDSERISLEGLQAGVYFVEVFGFRGATAVYDIQFELPVVITPTGDYLEPNDSAAAASAIRGSGAIDDLSIHDATDKDFFVFTVPEGATGGIDDFAEIRFSHRQGDLDLFLLDVNGNTVDSREGTTDVERLELNGLGQGTYYLKVLGFEGAVAEYNLTFHLPSPTEGLPQDDLEPNDEATLQAATQVRESGVVSGLTIHSATDVDYFQFTLPDVVRSDRFVQATFSHSAGDLSVRLLDRLGRPVAISNGVTDVERISLRGLASGLYYVQVSGVKEAVNRYSIEFNLPDSGAIRPDAFETNDILADATDLRESGRVANLTIHSPSDIDLFRINVGQPRGGDFVAIDFSNAVGDLDMFLLNSTGEVVGVSNSVLNRELLFLDRLTTGTYFVQVVGFDGAIGQYGLTLELNDASQPDNLDRFEPNDDADEATDLRRPINERVEELTIHSTQDGSNPDFYSFELGRGANAAHSVLMEFGGDIDFELLRANGTRVASVGVPGTDANARRVPLAGEAAGTYVVHVFGLDATATGSYALDFRTPSDRAVTADRLEPNNSTAAPTVFGGIEGRRLTEGLSIHRANGASDVDVFEFQLLREADDEHFVEIQFSADQGNLDLELLDADGNRIGLIDSTTHDERLSLAGQPAGSYFARVFAGTANDAVDYRLTIDAPHRRGGFQIDVNFTDGNLSDSQRAVFTDAAARWSEVIVGDVPDVRLANGTIVDDVVIDVSAPPIDGLGNVLGQAGPTHFRQGSAIPYRGIMQFDVDDLSGLEASDAFVDVILHEMGHVLGMGTLWNFLGFVSGHGGVDPAFVGEKAVAEYSTLVGTAQDSVPVANTGGQGTRDAHWRESVFTDEIMTGFLSGNVRPISRVTIGSLEDIGYAVDYEAADEFALTSPAGRTQSGGNQQAAVALPGEIQVVGILAPGGTGPDTIGNSNPAEFEAGVVASIQQLYPADEYEARTVNLRANQTLRGLTIQPGSRSEREDVFTFTLAGRGTFEDAVEVTGGVPGQLLDLQLRSADNSTVLSNGLIGGQRLSLAGYDPGVYFISVTSDDPNEYTFSFDGQFTAGEPDIAAFDLDANGSFQFSTDGILLLAYSLGGRGEALEPFRAAGDVRTGAQIETTIDLLADAIDTDGNGTFQFSSDGILLLAHSLGTRNGALLPFAAPGAPRNGEAITARLNGLVSDVRHAPRNRVQSLDVDSRGFVAALQADVTISTDVESRQDIQILAGDQVNGIPADEIVTWWSTDPDNESDSTRSRAPEITELDLGLSLETSHIPGSEWPWATSASELPSPEAEMNEASDKVFEASADLLTALNGLQ